MHAVDTQSWGELVEAARTVVMTVVIFWVGMFSTSTWVHMARPLPRDVQVMRTHFRPVKAGAQRGKSFGLYLRLKLVVVKVGSCP